MTSENSRTATDEMAKQGAVPTGNYTDKYGSKNPIQRRLVDSFMAVTDEVLDGISPTSLLDVGCGEGVLTRRWAEGQMGGGRIVGIDLEDSKLEREWKANPGPDNLEFKVGIAERLPFADNEFDTVTALEVLEHVPEPRHMLDEMSRVSNRKILVSVPREPIWRILNMARGAYIKDLGNTPGHLNHWSKRGFVQMLERYGRIDQVLTPFPWTMVLLRLDN